MVSGLGEFVPGWVGGAWMPAVHPGPAGIMQDDGV